MSSLPAQSRSHRLEGDVKGISLLLKKTSGLLFGFVVGGKSEGAFAMWEAEVRGKGVVRTGQRRKKKQKQKLNLLLHLFLIIIFKASLVISFEFLRSLKLPKELALLLQLWELQTFLGWHCLQVGGCRDPSHRSSAPRHGCSGFSQPAMPFA